MSPGRFRLAYPWGAPVDCGLHASLWSSMHLSTWASTTWSMKFTVFKLLVRNVKSCHLSLRTQKPSAAYSRVTVLTISPCHCFHPSAALQWSSPSVLEFFWSFRPGFWMYSHHRLHHGDGSGPLENQQSVGVGRDFSCSSVRFPSSSPPQVPKPLLPSGVGGREVSNCVWMGPLPSLVNVLSGGCWKVSWVYVWFIIFFDAHWDW